MRIAANLNVLDEVEFIEPCIRHLRTIGIDLIVLTDLGSIDGTTDRLERFARDPDIHVIQMRRGEDPWCFPARMYKKTIEEFTVDRVLFLDADEFWLPKGGSLKDTASLATADALSVRRLNVPLVQGRGLLPDDLSPNNYQNLFVVARPVPNAQGRFQSDQDLAWSMTEVAPKMIINPQKVDGVAIGTHRVVARDEIHGAVVRPDDLMIAHVPFSTVDRFMRKLANIERSLTAFGHRLVGSQAWHWQRWLRLAKEGKIEQEFERQILAQENFEKAVAEGVIQSVQAVFQTLAAPR